MYCLPLKQEKTKRMAIKNKWPERTTTPKMFYRKQSDKRNKIPSMYKSKKDTKRNIFGQYSPKISHK
jgi:hypothetical protein